MGPQAQLGLRKAPHLPPLNTAPPSPDTGHESGAPAAFSTTGIQ